MNFGRVKIVTFKWNPDSDCTIVLPFVVLCLISLKLSLLNVSVFNTNSQDQVQYLPLYIDYGSDDFKYHYKYNTLLGFANGSLITFTVLSINPIYLLVGGLIGASQGLLYTYFLR